MLVRVLKELFRRSNADRGATDEIAQAVQAALHHWSRGALDLAETHCRDAIALQPDHGDAMHLLGSVLHAAGRPTEAIAVLRRTCALKPDSTEVHFHLGNALVTTGDLTEAIAAFEASTRLKPGFAPALACLGNVYRMRGQLDEAIRCYRNALQSDASIGQAWHNLGSVYYECGKSADAVAAFDEALRLSVESSETRFSRSLALLANCDLDRGWTDYEARKSISRHAADARFSELPIWRGENLAGRTLLITSEQGVGDEILFASMYPELIDCTKLCIIICCDKLASLFRRSFPQALVYGLAGLPSSDALESIDFQISAGSLARYLRRDLGSFRRHAGFLRPDPERVAHWRARLGCLGAGLRVGICWRSANRSALREFANTSLIDWGELFAIPGVRFVSLQYDECEGEIDIAQQRFGIPIQRFADLDYFDDLDEVGALMCALDLVISSRTTVSWEASALGVPTWQLSGGGDWRGHGTSGVPWMPHLLRFSRAWNQPWSEVLGAVAHRLRERQAHIARATP